MTMFFFGILYALFVSLVNYFGMFLSVKSLMAWCLARLWTIMYHYVMYGHYCLR